MLILAVPPLTDPFVQSVLFRSLDPAASELVDRAARPWTLKAEVLPLVSERFRIGLAVYGLLFLAFTLAAAWAAGALRQGCIRGFEAVSGIALFYLVFISHWGFATGIAVTFRAAVFAYLLAAVLGLTWTGLQSLRSSRATIPIFGAISLPAARGSGVVLGAAAGGVRHGGVHRGPDRDRQGHSAGGRRCHPLRRIRGRRWRFGAHSERARRGDRVATDRCRRQRIRSIRAGLRP